jgi:acetyltransferase-like isoleucine patch superfamily enzyme
MPIDRRHAFAGGRAYRRPLPFWMLRQVATFGVLWNYVDDMIRSWHAWSIFERNATVGQGVALGPNAWCVNKGKREDIGVGNRVVCRGVLRREAFGQGKLVIHDDVYIGDDCLISCAAGIEIHPFVMLAHGVQVFDNDSHPLDTAYREADYRAARKGVGERPHIAAAPITIEANVWVGFGSTVLKGITLGTGCVVAACSVVTESIPPQCVAAGNPACVVKELS